MAQHDFNIANQGFPAFRADLNNALSAAVSLSAGATEPSTTFAYQLWYDETADVLKIRNDANDAWITLFTFDQVTNSVAVSGEELVDDTSPQLGGDLDVNGNDINFGDNDKAIFGAGSDLQIYHDSSNSYVQDAGTGVLIIKSNQVNVNSTTDAAMATFVETGASTLYFNGNPKLATTATGVDVTGALDVTGILSAAATESKSSSGYVKLPSGIYLQWKTAGANTGGVTTAWPITFPNAVWGAWAINNNQTNPPAPSVSITTSNFTLTVSAGGPQCYVLGIGY